MRGPRGANCSDLAAAHAVIMARVDPLTLLPVVTVVQGQRGKQFVMCLPHSPDETCPTLSHFPCNPGASRAYPVWVRQRCESMQRRCSHAVAFGQQKVHYACRMPQLQTPLDIHTHLHEWLDHRVVVVQDQP
jgi:hypothetical protein